MLRVGTVGTSSIMRTIQEAIRLTDGMECRVVYSRTEERAKEFAAAQGGLLHISHSFLTALDLVGFLKPQDANVPKWQLDGFDFLWVIQSSEQNALPRRQIDALQRALCAAELGGKPQFVDGPKDLCIHTVPHRVANLACHQRMAVRVF